MPYVKIENNAVIYPPKNHGNRLNVDKDIDWLTSNGFIEMTPEKIAEYSKPPFAEQKSLREKELWSNYKKFQQTYVDAEDLTLAVVCASKGSEKGAAVQMWVMRLWERYYEVKDALAAAESVEELSSIDITAESFGVPPYTIRELNEEAAAALETMKTEETA